MPLSDTPAHGYRTASKALRRDNSTQLSKTATIITRSTHHITVRAATTQVNLDIRNPRTVGWDFSP
jgi:hypothetical protein